MLKNRQWFLMQFIKGLPQVEIFSKQWIK